MPPSPVFPLCPQPPDWVVDWAALRERFLWLETLADVPQDATYHAEGDVLTHTRMVAEALAAMETWRVLPGDERSALFAAALLHDIAKPTCTQIDADGRISSPRHARIGAQSACYLLWLGEGFDTGTIPPLSWRERVTRLVRHHGLPLWFFEKADPARAVITASQSVRLDYVALLAEADVRGRVCADQQALLERIELFRAYCEEQGCLIGPRIFASDHSRFLYFRTPQAQPDYAAYDDTVCEVTLLSGLPGAGKDTWLRDNLPDLPVIALDEIRHELHIAPEDTQGEVVRVAKERARELLRGRQPFAWNATNITRSLRGQLIDLFAAYHARVHIVYLDAPYSLLIQRNASRRGHMPESVILKLARKLEVPDLTEAHRVDWITN
ncbi:MAG: AAA family ATPase [Ktedonobacterales bacterium]